MRKFVLGTCLLAFLVGTVRTADAIPVGTFGELDNWATSAARVSGTGGDYAGVPALVGLVGDDLTDGAINIGPGDSFDLGFAPGILNRAGDDFVIFDGRFSFDGVYITINATELYVPSAAFTDSGLDLVLKNSGFTFELYGAALELGAWGVAPGGTIFSMIIRGDGQSDIIGVSGTDPVDHDVPEPGTLLLLGSALAGVALRIRRS